MIYTQAISPTSPAPVQAAAQDTSDETLVAQIAQRDKHALQLLYSRHHVRIFRFALRFLNDEAAAEDTVSEVFIDVWRQAERFEGRSQVTTWLLAIARNKALSLLRRRSSEELDDEVAEFIEDPSDNPEAAMLKSQRASVLQDCLTQLSPAHREGGRHRHRSPADGVLTTIDVEGEHQRVARRTFVEAWYAVIPTEAGLLAAVKRSNT